MKLNINIELGSIEEIKSILSKLASLETALQAAPQPAPQPEAEAVKQPEAEAVKQPAPQPAPQPAAEAQKTIPEFDAEILSKEDMMKTLADKLRDMAKNGRKDEAKQIMLKFKVTALSKLNTLNDAEIEQMYETVEEAYGNTL